MNNKKENIFFSIIICCYNSEKYIAETLDSIINQSYKNWEIIIIDDGSKDLTKSIIYKYIKKKIPINYFYQNNKGFASARNIAIEKSKYEWIVIIDHDDVCETNRLSLQLNNIKDFPNCILFFGDALYFDKKLSFSRFKNTKNKEKFNPAKLNLNKGKCFKNLIYYGCFITSSTVIFKKDIINKVGGFDNNLYFVSDYDFFLRLSQEYNFFCSEKIISKWRIHQNQLTNRNIHLYYSELNYILKKYINHKEIGILLKINMLIKYLKNCYRILLINLFSNVKE